MALFSNDRLLPRFKAASIHLIISATVIALTGVLVFWFWFPKPYGNLSGGAHLWMLIAGVDLILGPLLTFLVFDIRKSRRELVMDLAIIGMMQVAAMAYGLWSTSQARPIYLVHEVDRFKVIARSDVDDTDLLQVQEPFRHLSIFGGVPAIGLRPAKDGNERLNDINSALQGVDVSMMPRRWQVLSVENKAQMRQFAMPAEQMEKRLNRPEDVQSMMDAVKQTGMPASALLAFPIVGRNFMTWTALLDAKTLAIKAYAPIDLFEAPGMKKTGTQQ